MLTYLALIFSICIAFSNALSTTGKPAFTTPETLSERKGDLVERMQKYIKRQQRIDQMQESDELGSDSKIISGSFDDESRVIPPNIHADLLRPKSPLVHMHGIPPGNTDSIPSAQATESETRQEGKGCGCDLEHQLQKTHAIRLDKLSTGMRKFEKQPQTTI